MRKGHSATVGLVLALAVLGGLEARAQAQIKDPRVPPKVLEPDKVKVDRFDATPNPVPATAATTNVTFVGRNLSLGPLSIPWRIFKGSVLWQAGLEPNVPAGKTFTKTYTLNLIPPPPVTLELRLDPDKTLGEFGLPQLANNNARMVVARANPGIRQIVLNAAKARAVGATFNVIPERNPAGMPVPCDCGTRRWFDPADPNDSAMTLHNEVPSAYFRLICRGNLGGKMDAEAFASFRLKNGYKVVNVRWDQTNGGPDAGFTTLEQPQIGSDNPFTKVHVWGNRSCNFEVWLKIIVEGPADKEPY